MLGFESVRTIVNLRGLAGPTVCLDTLKGQYSATAHGNVVYAVS